MAFENGSRVMNGTFGTVWADGSDVRPDGGGPKADGH